MHKADMEEPTEEDCCHSDCVNCVLEIFQKQKRSKGLSTLKPASYANSMMSQTRYKPFRLMQIDIGTQNVKIYSFVPDESSDAETRLHFTPGEHVVLRNDPTTADAVHLSRPYTLIPWDKSNGAFSVMIKLYAEGQMSQYISGWVLGQKCYWRGPYGDFTYEPNKYEHIYMVCIGTGVAPMYAISKQIIENENDETIVHLLYGSSTPDDIIFREEINELSSYWNFTCTHFIPHCYNEKQKKFNETFVNGKITTESVTDIVKHINKTLVLICGSKEFNSAIQNSLIEYKSLDVYVFS